ncbi:MAG: pyruvate ferredoxin oxidoreductase [Gammaproteobacteria bacterium]|jgi:pyruvate/2-oxoacid:ferredoxin oxidoreductase alpha subunit|nr:pyruvate ferredoxin oxidoreductase [Gammaproteobacteria bacterium]
MSSITNLADHQLLSGNHAVAWGARLARPQVIPVYPITPQSPIMEKLGDFHAAGEIDAEVLTPESEHSAMAAAIAASLAGARVFTATASQGILLMHELLHYAAGGRAPIVMCNVNRTVASPWAFWPDATDSLSQRDTGWIQLYSETPQESLDSTIQAFRVAETVSLPTMVCHDAFYVSHAMEPVALPDQALVDGYLPAYDPEHFVEPGRGESFGYVIDQATFNRTRRDLDEAMARVPETLEEADTAWRELTGRSYGVIERYRLDDADTAIVTMGSMAGTARVAVDEMRAAGERVGLLKVRLFRPFPVAHVRTALAGIGRAVVLDRNYSPGLGGMLHQELKAALFGLNGSTPAVHGLLAGVGGVNVTPEKIRQFVGDTTDREPQPQSLWVE